MNSSRNPYARKFAILGIFIIIVGLLTFVSLIKIAGKVIVIFAVIMAIGVVASKISNSGEDKSQPKHVKSSRSDSKAGKAFSKWWRS